MASIHATAHKPTSIVVGVDFTPCSAVALGQAIRLAGVFSVPIHVVHVIDTLVVIEIESVLSSLQQGIRTRLITGAQDAWVEFVEDIPGAETLSLNVSINNRIVGILRSARENACDLLVLGAFGEHRPDVGVGTVATACVRDSATDVLLVRDTQTGPFKIVVAGVDFSETSAGALQQAALIALHEGAELYVLHVFSAPWSSPHRVDLESMVPLHLQQEYRHALNRRLQEFSRPIADAHPNLRFRTECFDDPGARSGIVEYANGVSADLIVVGTRGRTNLRDILLGSTAEKALVHTHCSILAVKPRMFTSPLSSGSSAASESISSG